MNNKILAIFGLLSVGMMNAQTGNEKVDNFLNNTDINFLLRSSLEVPQGEGNPSVFKQNEARMQITGKINPDLAYNVRFRLNRNTSPLSDNAPSSLDYASLEYTFGKDKKWAVTLGKQAIFVGSWEYEKNPTYEYTYSNYLIKQLNLFAVGGKLAYSPNKNNNFQLYVFNANNNSFSALHENAKYAKNQLKASKYPLGFNFVWRGNLWNNKLKTLYSLHTSQIAEGKQNYGISIGNKLVLPKFEAYLDIQHNNSAVDYANMISPVINKYNAIQVNGYQNIFAEKVQYQSAVFRADYSITPKWIVTGKTGIENINSNTLGNNMSHHYMNLIGLEFKPFEKQNFRFFAYFHNDSYKYNDKFKNIQQNTSKNTIAVGVLYLMNIL